ncbi:thymidylate synthase (FAD) [Hydrogenispora ethanolica]|jgi:thymidylate synthase (FAD)|uniref:Flavin-dependent thymidylate synthase n=1 Tax=Hydrogenispora ethanolica TaxID=1082276 RepID=A0A4R1S4Z8_HYDET|nr:FAD-dependent thymidylate synthase [Hydrogenispora ethanolica]TCL74301.1 thymidylate synthase (FAD) [Hydrogenispora ethanolica]
MLKVKLLAYTPEPDRLVAAAARLCYSPVGVDELLEKLTPERMERLLGQLRESGHDSPIEHASFSFGIEGVSRALTHQLVRHRIASFSQQSQRYVKNGDFETIVPPSVARDPGAQAAFTAAMDQIRTAYRELLAAGIPAEDARFVLPNACETKIMVTMNARSLINFLEIRACTRAQWEIRALALAMRDELRQVAPLLFRLAGPSCETRGYCREGKMGCGRAPVLAELLRRKEV